MYSSNTGPLSILYIINILRGPVSSNKCCHFLTISLWWKVSTIGTIWHCYKIRIGRLHAWAPIYRYEAATLSYLLKFWNLIISLYNSKLRLLSYRQIARSACDVVYRDNFDTPISFHGHEKLSFLYSIGFFGCVVFIKFIITNNPNVW